MGRLAHERPIGATLTQMAEGLGVARLPSEKQRERFACQRGSRLMAETGHRNLRAEQHWQRPRYNA